MTEVQQPEPDAALIHRARSGDPTALRSLLEMVGPVVSQWALARAGDADDAADLAQEVLILMVRQLPSFRGDSRFLSWLFSVTRNQAIESHRRKARMEKKTKRYLEHSGAERSSGPESEREIDRGRIQAVITTFLKELPQRQREVFQMSEIQGLGSVEIAGILEIEPGSVRAALFKARRRLRAKILEQHPELVQEYAP